MSRATKADQARLLNAAYRLLERQMEVADAAQQLARRFALSRRQAYRYLEQASALSAPVAAVEPTVAITFKLSVSTVRALRAHARRSGFTLGLSSFLGAFRRRG
jgi:predicted DNA-binding transcriptional regulator YafY